MLLLSSDLIRRSTVVGVGSQTAGAEASKLADDQPGRPWIATDVAQAWVEWQLPELTMLDTFAALNGVLDQVDTIRWRVAATQGALTAAPTWDSTELPYWPAGVDPRAEVVQSLVRTDAVAALYVRMDIGIVGGLQEVVLGNAAFGGAYRPTGTAIVPLGGVERTQEDKPIAVETEARSEIVFASRARRGVACEIKHLDSAQAITELERIRRHVGTASNVLLVPRPDDALLHEWIYFGRLAELTPIEPGPYLRAIGEESWGVRLQVMHRL